LAPSALVLPAGPAGCVMTIILPGTATGHQRRAHTLEPDD
jgi:hypothetical protein